MIEQPIPDQPDIFTGPATPAQILALADVKEWVEHRIAYMTQDGDIAEEDARMVARGRAVKLFREGYFGI